MAAIGFAKAAFPALALALAAFAAPAAAAPRLGDEDFEVFAQEAADGDEAGPATRRIEERRRANDSDWFRAPANQGPEDFPSAEVHDAVVANTRAATARAMYRRAESSLHAGVREAVREFEQSRELREALAAEDRAYEALQDARREALRDVVDQPKYQAMQDLRETLTQRIADRREGAAPAPAVAAAAPATRLVSTAEVKPRAGDDVLAMASLKLRVGTDARELEREALADNDRVRRAREDLVEASAKVAELRASFDRTLRTNEDLRQARAELEDARVARVTAETYFKGANLAAGRALDFAYYLHRYDYYRYRPYDYGYGYGGNRYGYPYYGVSYIGRARR